MVAAGIACHASAQKRDSNQTLRALELCTRDTDPLEEVTCICKNDTVNPSMLQNGSKVYYIMSANGFLLSGMSTRQLIPGPFIPLKSFATAIPLKMKVFKTAKRK